MQLSFYKVKKERLLKKELNILRSFSTERNVLAFFYVLCRRTLLSLQKNVALFVFFWVS